MVVLDRHRPVWREAVFETNADDAAPAGFVGAVEYRAGGKAQDGCADEAAVLVVGHGRAALHVEQRVVPGITDLAGEQTEGLDLRTVGEGSAEEQAGIRSAQISPIALRFQAEYPGAGLPAVTDLTTGNATGRIMASLGRYGRNHAAAIVVDVPALAA